MYIRKIHIQNYRVFNDFTMEFHKGLNVIIGANNSGKTGLLYAVKLLRSPADISINDFNKNNLMHYGELYTKEAPQITIEYNISHQISEDDTNDESIIHLLPFLGMKEIAENRQETDGSVQYNIGAQIKAVYSLDVKYLDEYRKAVSSISNFDEFLILLKRFVGNHYSWNYTNGVSETKAEQKEAMGVFDIRFIGAERTSEEVRKETKREIDTFTKDANNAAGFDKFKQDVSQELEKLLIPTITKLSDLFENEKNVIGLEKGNVSIASSVRADLSLSDAYITEVKDTKAGFTVPLQHNGLGYNNLINIYMLIKLTEIKKGKDFRILCLEEPEAHLHPAMQYKLFKYLRNLDKADDLNQQIFVTSHSSNISAVAGIENMFMLAYNREGKHVDCCQQSLSKQFQDVDGTTNKKIAKNHLAKFLDVTRSDMLFADKVILVEGIAEKLLMPVFMEKCGCPYEDEHISIVEIGGKHFEHFVELFNCNKVNKKVLCITDNDFVWFDDNNQLKSIEKYKAEAPEHIVKLNERFPISNFKIQTQSLGGRTFEDEFSLTNHEDKEVTKIIFKKAVPDYLGDFLDKHGFSCAEWDTHIGEIDGRSRKRIHDFMTAYKNRVDKATEYATRYEKILFSEMYLHYAKGMKGDIALGLLVDEALIDEAGNSKLVVPQYIQEGLKWLLK